MNSNLNPPVPGFLRSRVQSFGNAFRGCWYVVRTQRNAWIEVAVAAIIFSLSFWLRLDARSWAVLILTTALVFIAELLNTAIEVVVNLASPQQHPLARVAKDVGAGAVLTAAVTSVLIGLLILGPPLFAVVSSWFAPR